MSTSRDLCMVLARVLGRAARQFVVGKRKQACFMGLCESTEPQVDLLEPDHGFGSGRPTLLKVLLLGDSGYCLLIDAATYSLLANLQFNQGGEDFAHRTVSCLIFVLSTIFSRPSLPQTLTRADIAARYLWRTTKPPLGRIFPFKK